MKLKREGDDSPQALAAQVTELDLNVLQQKREMGDFAEYEAALSTQVFSNQVIRDHFNRFCSGALDNGRDLRIRVVVADEALELHQVIWETLREPVQSQRISTMERVWLTRYILSTDMRPTSIEEREKVRALVAASNPTDLNNYKLAVVDAEGEMRRAKDALAQTHVTELNHSKVTLDNLLSGIRNGVDIVYLACHGILAHGEPILFLQNDDGSAAKVNGKEFVRRLGELHKLPRLIVLASCQSAGAGHENALAALGPQLAAIGVPAVLAMQGNISMETVEQFAPAFFRELTRHGQIDRALAVARSMVQAQHDFWVPVLFLRSESGKIWHIVQGVTRSRRPVPHLLPFTANRHQQEEELADAVSKRQELGNYPIVAIVSGDELQCQDKFLDRIQNITLPKIFNVPNGSLVVTRVDLRWPEQAYDPKRFRNDLQTNLSDAVLHKPVKAELVEIQNVWAKLPGPVLVGLHIPMKVWEKFGVGVLHECITFWQSWPALNPRQDLFIFLFIHYPQSVPSIGNWLARWRSKQNCKQLCNPALFKKYDHVICTVLSELGNITREQAEDWARQREPQEFCDLQIMLTRIRDIFTPCGGHLPMETLAKHLNNVLASGSD